MLEFHEPIDEGRRDEIIEAIVARIVQFGMTVPAIFFLEMNKPLSYFGGQAMHFFAPIVGVFFETFEDYAYFFDQRDNVELLIQRLELAAMEEEAERKAEKATKKEAKKARRMKRGSMLDEALNMDSDKNSGSKPEGTIENQ
jgi:hypothetical protein